MIRMSVLKSIALISIVNFIITQPVNSETLNINKNLLNGLQKIGSLKSFESGDSIKILNQLKIMLMQDLLNINKNEDELLKINRKVVQLDLLKKLEKLCKTAIQKNKKAFL